ncbi:MAG TPA: hypothetical protein VGE88_06420 [Lysobacter sp.]
MERKTEQQDFESERILSRKLARELTADEINWVAGGDSHPGTCSGSDCDQAN